MRVAQPVTISDEDHAHLRLILSRPQKKSARVLLKSKAVLLMGEGLSNEKISRELNLTRQTVAHWRRLYISSGIDRLMTEKPRPGRKPKITEPMITQIVQLREQQKNERGKRWTLQRLAHKFGLSISSVSALLQSNVSNKSKNDTFAIDG